MKENIIDYSSSLLSTIGSVLSTYSKPFINVLIGILVFLIGRFIIKMITKFLKKLFIKLKLDELGAKLSDIDLFNGVDIYLPEVLSRVFYYFMLIILIIVSVDIMGIESLSAGIKSIIAYLPVLLSAGMLFLGGAIIASIIRKFLRTATESLNITSGKFISDAVFYFLLTVISLTAINQAGFDTTLLANHFTMFIGAILIAFIIGFGIASKDIMSSMLGSFYTKEKIEVGQKIVIGNIKGTIDEIDSTSVTIKTSAKKYVSVPMNKLITETFEIEK